MPAPETRLPCSLYLVTPPLSAANVDAFGTAFAEVLSAAPVASALIKLAPGSEGEAKVIVAPLLRIAVSRNCALLLENDARLAARLGADGVHVAGAGEALDEALASLKPERIVGAGALRMRDEAMTAGEKGADYVMFGEPRGAIPAMALELLAERVAWWAEIFELPCVAYAEINRGGARPGACGGRFRRARPRGLERALPGGGRPAHGPPAYKRRGGRFMIRAALFATLGVAAVSAAVAQSPAVPPASPFATPSTAALRPPGFPSPLPPRADGRPPDIAFGAYQRGNFLFALKEAERRIDDNPRDAAAMTLIGAIYHDGAAVGRNDFEASRWYRLASNLGDPQAAYELGVLLLEGANGVPKDVPGAKEQFERAAAKKHPGALYNLGVMALDASNGRKPDFAKAAQYFLQSANAGDDNGAYSYGVMVREGKGVPQDIAELAHWLKRAADGGIVAGEVEYAIMLFNGDGVKKDEAGAVKILRIAAAKGNPIAQNRLAHLYVDGGVVPRDLAEAAAWNSFAKAGGLSDEKSRCRHGQPDERRAQAVHQARPRPDRLLTGGSKRRVRSKRGGGGRAWIDLYQGGEAHDPTQRPRRGRHRAARRTEPRLPPGLSRPDRRRGRPGACAEASGLRQFRPWLCRLRPWRQGGLARRDRPQSRNRHRL